MPLNNKYRMGSEVWSPTHEYALVISIETESGLIAEDHMPPVGPSPRLSRVLKNSNRHCLSGEQSVPRKQFNLMGKELLNIACHVWWSPIILLEHG
ncbi:hypothetical protein TNCV_1517751 [Trichonephila clavipes]|nr:hypothetical protein TNCV_1517751 [Trichonephila clavipes]